VLRVEHTENRIFVKILQESIEAEEMTVLGKLLGLRLLFL
jgi:hypothetical protein